MLDLAIENRVAILTINRPARRNALGTELVEMLEEKLLDLSGDADVGAVVLTGAAPSFCAGSDLKELGAMDVRGMVRHEARTASMARAIGFLDLPVIAAVEGHALGGGFILAMSCDLVVTAETAKWSLPEVPNGWLPPWGLKALASRVGMTTARRLVWGYEVLDGATACDLGVADYLAPPDGALEKAREIAVRLAALPRVAVKSTKRYFQAEVLGMAEVWDVQAGEIFAENCAHDAAVATLNKFAVKK
jgi:enoyl-CoA hydratase/carnithine racemase